MWSLVIVSYSPKLGHAAYPLAMVETQIARAQNSHLKIHFYGHEGTYPDHKQIEMFKSLARHALRWGELNVLLTLALIPLLADLRGRLPSLHKVWMKWSRSTGLPVHAQSIDAFRDAPHLLDCRSTSLRSTSPVTNSKPRGRHEILKLATNLVEACITNFYQSSMPESGEMIELSCLRRLYVHDGRHEDGLNLGTLKFLYARGTGHGDICTPFIRTQKREEPYSTTSRRLPQTIPVPSKSETSSHCIPRYRGNHRHLAPISLHHRADKHNGPVGRRRRRRCFGPEAHCF
ncbi:hypothetical protein C8R47DRAFT_1283830 [Mycena vitilis]|nr:hypothetical protein C8R47DRAFT_1283830 [Mycena vitilis]